MKNVTANLAATLALGLFASNASAIVITPNTDATDLVNTLLGMGVTLSGTPTFTGGTGQIVSAGTFTDGLFSGIGIESGVVLTSGAAALIDNTNDSDSSSQTFSGGGDADLQTLIPGFNLFDTTFLEFDFTTATGDLFFQYVFGSEEYNEFVDSSFNDVFGFFVDGVNIAIAPSGDPVSINNVNCGNPFTGAGPNCTFFNNNDVSDGGPFFAFEYDGFTDVFTANALGLGMGQHTIKLAIADAGDSALDSGVFLAASSFSPTDPTDPTPVPEPSTAWLLCLGILSLSARRLLRRRHG